MPSPAVIRYDAGIPVSYISPLSLKYGEHKDGMFGYYEQHYRGQTRYEKTELALRRDCENAGASNLYYRGNHENEDGSTSDTIVEVRWRRMGIKRKLEMFMNNNNNDDVVVVKDLASNTRSKNKNKLSPPTTMNTEPPQTRSRRRRHAPIITRSPVMTPVMTRFSSQGRTKRRRIATDRYVPIILSPPTNNKAVKDLASNTRSKNKTKLSPPPIMNKALPQTRSCRRRRTSRRKPPPKRMSRRDVSNNNQKTTTKSTFNKINAWNKNNDIQAIENKQDLKKHLRNTPSNEFIKALCRGIENDKLTVEGIVDRKFLYEYMNSHVPLDEDLKLDNDNTKETKIDHRLWSGDHYMPDASDNRPNKHINIKLHFNADILSRTLIAIGETKQDGAVTLNKAGTRILLYNNKGKLVEWQRYTITENEVSFPSNTYVNGKMIRNNDTDGLLKAVDNTSKKTVYIDIKHKFNTNRRNIKSRVVYGMIGDYLSSEEIQKRINKAKEYNVSLLAPMILLKVRRIQKTQTIQTAKNKESILDEENKNDKKFMKVLKEIESFFLILREATICQSHQLKMSMLNRWIWIAWNYNREEWDGVFKKEEMQHRVSTRSKKVVGHKKIEAILDDTIYNVKVSVSDVEPNDITYQDAVAILHSMQSKDDVTWKFQRLLCYQLPSVQTFMKLFYGRDFDELYNILLGIFQGGGLNSSKAEAQLQLVFEMLIDDELDEEMTETFCQLRSKKRLLILNEMVVEKNDHHGVPADEHVLRFLITNFAKKAGIDYDEKEKKKPWTTKQKDFARSVCRLLSKEVSWFVNELLGQMGQFLATGMEETDNRRQFALSVLRTLVCNYSQYNKLADRWVKNEGWSRQQRRTSAKRPS